MTEFRYSHIKGLDKESFDSFRERLETADRHIKTGDGEGSDFLGWRDLPENYDREEYKRLKKAAAFIRENSEALLVIGIGGSYLGARACIEYIKTQYHNSFDGCKVYFIGNSFSGRELENVLMLCKDKRICVNVISKSGTTTESSVAFRIVREYMETRYSEEEINRRIFATTDKKRGALKNLADQKGWECFVIPDDIGGRFSVLTPVGLLPAAVAGLDTDAMLEGAREERKNLYEKGLDNDAYKYAVARNIMLSRGKNVELLVSYDPDFRFMIEWFKQLFGESEGKDNKGIFPAGAIYSSDLHSLGQYVQQGQRLLFETLCRTKNDTADDIIVPFDKENGDGLNFLSGMKMSEINEKASLGTLLAHRDGQADTFIVETDDRSEKSLGSFIYFMFFACAASGYILGVNPFNQPGVEEYKKNMFALLGKPGYEDRMEIISEKIKTLSK